MGYSMVCAGAGLLLCIILSLFEFDLVNIYIYGVQYSIVSKHGMVDIACAALTTLGPADCA